MTELSPWLKRAITAYDADFADIAADSKTEDEAVEQSRHVGDTLFTFLMIELSQAEDCDSAEEARRRVKSAIYQLEKVKAELDAMVLTAL